MLLGALLMFFYHHLNQLRVEVVGFEPTYLIKVRNLIKLFQITPSCFFKLMWYNISSYT